jgi:hypothetical protein
MEGGGPWKRKYIYIYSSFKGHCNLYQLFVPLAAKKKHFVFKTTAFILEFYNDN